MSEGIPDAASLCLRSASHGYSHMSSGSLRMLAAAFCPQYPEWTLTKELCKLAERPDLQSALIALGLVPHDVSMTAIQVLEAADGWYRGGAETFIYRFDIAQASGITRSFLLKACTCYTPPHSLADTVESWITRRRLLESLSISTPQLYAIGNGQLLEEYIPRIIDMDFLQTTSMRDALLDRLAELAGALTCLGFLPVAPFADLRSRGEDVTVVDFGEDLGPPGRSPDFNDSLLRQLLQQLKDWEIAISSQELSRLRERFAWALRQLHAPAR